MVLFDGSELPVLPEAVSDDGTAAVPTAAVRCMGAGYQVSRQVSRLFFFGQIDRYISLVQWQAGRFPFVSLKYKSIYI